MMVTRIPGSAFYPARRRPGLARSRRAAVRQADYSSAPSPKTVETSIPAPGRPLVRLASLFLSSRCCEIPARIPPPGETSSARQAPPCSASAAPAVSAAQGSTSTSSSSPSSFSILQASLTFVSGEIGAIQWALQATPALREKWSRAVVKGFGCCCAFFWQFALGTAARPPRRPPGRVMGVRSIALPLRASLSLILI